MATPAAPYASAATSPRPSWKPPAPSTGMSSAHRVAPPGAAAARSGTRAGVAAALAALGDDGVDAPLEHLLGVAAGADRRASTSTPASCSRRDRVLGRRPGETRPRRTPSPTTNAMRSSRSGWSARKLTPNGLSVRVLDLAHRLLRAVAGVIVTAARIPRPPAALVAAVRRAPDTQPMPVCTIGCSTPSQFAERWCAQRVVHAGLSPSLPRTAARRDR